MIIRLDSVNQPMTNDDRLATAQIWNRSISEFRMLIEQRDMNISHLQLRKQLLKTLELILDRLIGLGLVSGY